MSQCASNSFSVPITRDRESWTRRATRATLMAAGIELYMKTEDRKILQRTILPAIARSPEYHRVLFIGCEWFTRGYRRIFRKCDYWTLEINPRNRKFGSRQHIVDGAENLASHFKPDSIDFIVCNGVIGWGLNDRAAIKRMLDSSWHCLSEHGVLLLGCNDLPEHTPVVLSELDEMKRFRPFVFPAVGVSELRIDTPLRHRFSFYTKVL
jgi:hypothetical protein